MTLGENIKKYRTEKGMTQKGLADQLHVTPQAVSRWEAGDVEPSIDTLKQMASLFECSMDDLFGLETKKEPVVIPEPQVIEKVVYTEATPALGVCDGCKKIIKDPKDLFKVEDRVVHGRTATIVTHVYCSNCKKKDDEMKQKMQEDLEADRKKGIYKRRIHSFVWPTLVFGVLLAVAIAMFSSGSVDAGIFYLVGGIIGYLLLATLILDNTFLTEWFVGIAGFGFVKMPGIIFEFSLDGFIFLIVVKIILWIISFLLGAAFAIFAIVFCGALSIFVYPVALSRSFRYYEPD